MSLYQNIRGALQVQAATASGFPAAAKRAYEGVRFVEPSDGSTWVKMTLIPATGRPYSVDGGTKQHTGMFQIDVFTAPGAGTGAGESLADAIKTVFAPGTRLSLNSEIVIIEYAERASVIDADPQWLQIPVTVGWRSFSSNN